MLDGLERYDGVDRCVGQRQGGGAARGKAQVSGSVALRGMRDRGRLDVDAHDVRGRCREQGTAVALAARDVRDPAARAEAAREGVAMPVLVRDLARDAGDEALA